jgi:hypothetical protein
VSLTRCGAWVLPWLLGGCAVDLWVGDATQDAGGQASTTSETGGTTALPPTTNGPDPSSTSGLETAEGTTLALEEGTSTGPLAEESSSTGPVAEESAATMGEIVCEGLGMLDCNELRYCLWYGTPKMGDCAPSPCENPRDDCWGLMVEGCQDLFACAFVGDPETGECAPIECVPCEVLGADQCAKTPTCVWNRAEMFCVPP